MIPDEAVEAAAKRIASHYGTGENNWEWYLTEAAEVLEAAAPYLMEREISPTRWWRAIAPDGSLLAETSATDDFTHLDLIDNPGVTFQRLYEEVPVSVWRDETP